MTGRPPDGGLGDRLRREADRHVPDADRIRRRLDRPAPARPRSGPPAAPRRPGLVAVLRRSGVDAAPRRYGLVAALRRSGVIAAPRRPSLVAALRRPGLVAAVAAGVATVLLVGGTSLVAVRAADRPGPPAVPPAATATTPTPTSTAGPGRRVPVPDPAGSLSAPEPTAPRTPTRPAGDRSPTAVSPTPPPGTGTPAPGPVAVDLQLRQVPAGTAVRLGPGGDWAVPGAGVRAGALAAPEVRGGTAGPGPYRLSWTGGTPTPAGTAVATWVSVDPAGAVRVEVPAGPGRRRLRLYVGTDGADVTAEVHLGAERRTVTLSAPAPAGVVTVTAESATDPLVVDLTGVARTAGGRFGLAAAVLTPS